MSSPSRKYIQKYRAVWETDHRMRAWIEAFPGDNTKAQCRLCERAIKAHLKSILGHAKGKRHIANLTKKKSPDKILEAAIEETLQPILIKMADGHDIAKEAVLAKSEEMPEGTPTVTGYDFNEGVNYHKLFESFRHSGFQATSFGCAVEEIKKMIACREVPLVEESAENLQVAEDIKINNNCTLFLGYTSNMVSCGVRETIRFLVQHKMVDCIVTTAGGVEEDLIKCLAPTYVGDWYLSGRELRLKGINRIGNLLVPNNNYCRFEDWVMPILDAMLEEQKEEGISWTPSKIISRLGREVGDPSSIAYWAWQNSIPVFSPALTDGSLGDMMYFHGIKSPGLIVDINEDLRRLNQLSKKSINTGMIIVGGGVIKHHICNANLMRNGANFSVFLNTASEWDGSDSGARPDEAVSWGKIKMDATPVKVYGEASFVFPLLVGETFARHHHQRNQQQQQQKRTDAQQE